ncbi:sulfur carrier protein ThiS adenylyltransferase ThiF [Peptostreptococcus faecalis]|uniref:sulfur carrier protein ThiS adenylyltransferase ThiF n=1 Tax=Peptostreptococcus faecalis TaxID=2045015 RepID=UPI0015E10AE5|nr:sulfur carrier protein ThiS adenylyltransferase ThiF [Peptostreptococcus faecalis]
MITTLNGFKLDEKMITERVGEKYYKKFKSARVCILGLGGLGSNISVYLARSGLGKLILVDYDIVEPSNINRQYYNTSHIGMKKTEALKNIINEINPFVEVEVKNLKIDKNNINEIIKNEKYVCEALDDADTKAMIVGEILSKYNDKIIISGSGMAGIENANNILTHKKFKNLYVCGDEESDFKKVEGMMAPKVCICAGHQANVVLKLIKDE